MFYFSDHHKIQKETMATYGFAVNKTVNQPSFPDDCQLDEASTDWKTAVTPFLCHRSNEEKKRTTRQNPDTQTRNSSSSNSNADATIQRIENEKIPKLWLCLFVCCFFFESSNFVFCLKYLFAHFPHFSLLCWRAEEVNKDDEYERIKTRHFQTSSSSSNRPSGMGTCRTESPVFFFNSF